MLTISQLNGSPGPSAWGQYAPQARPQYATAPTVTTINGLRGPFDLPLPRRGPPPKVRPQPPRAKASYSAGGQAIVLGLCVHPITGQVTNVATGAAVPGGDQLAPVATLPPCPVQQAAGVTATWTNQQDPTTTPTGGSSGGGSVPGDGGGGGDAVEQPPSPYPFVAPPTAAPKKWLPWAIGGGVLAAIGAVLVAVTHHH